MCALRQLEIRNLRFTGTVKYIPQQVQSPDQDSDDDIISEESVEILNRNTALNNSKNGWQIFSLQVEN
jgi:hypothetical protein